MSRGSWRRFGGGVRATGGQAADHLVEFRFGVGAEEPVEGVVKSIDVDVAVGEEALEERQSPLSDLVGDRRFGIDGDHVGGHVPHTTELDLCRGFHSAVRPEATCRGIRKTLGLHDRARRQPR